ncbi:hypothetical protein [Actinotalea solisilvae]|uniref:hypothetical protein n=1 Tax=Actinotalea solisilvae TaxID=2072922 RepID=UPI0018F21AC3|nr:hypothetical protein [Actinotalea solisilvae]
MTGKGLGINKDLEPLVRAVRRAGGTVEVTGSTHVRWTMPGGTVIHSGLTMSTATARIKQREIEKALAPTTPDQGAQRPYTIATDPRGKYLIIDNATGTTVPNKQGYARTFGTQDAARVAITELLRTRTQP